MRPGPVVQLLCFFLLPASVSLQDQAKTCCRAVSLSAGKPSKRLVRLSQGPNVSGAGRPFWPCEARLPPKAPNPSPRSTCPQAWHGTTRSTCAQAPGAARAVSRGVGRLDRELFLFWLTLHVEGAGEGLWAFLAFRF